MHPQPPITTPITADQATHLLRLYLKAKDENRPHFMADAFDGEAEVDMVLHTGAISFPSRMQGLDAITNALVRDFGRTYENIYTFYLDKPDNTLTRNAFSCAWMVVMSEKVTGKVWAGCGRYDWEFQRRDRWLVRRLRITIAAMQTLPADKLPALLGWIHGVAYPWTNKELVLAHMPDEPGLAPLRDYVRGLSVNAVL
ncbi:MAG: hypothetical protein V7642_5163 [Burkholderiales bacterium]